MCKYPQIIAEHLQFEVRFVMLFHLELAVVDKITIVLGQCPNIYQLIIYILLPNMDTWPSHFFSVVDFYYALMHATKGTYDINQSKSSIDNY